MAEFLAKYLITRPEKCPLQEKIGGRKMDTVKQGKFGHFFRLSSFFLYEILNYSVV
jgi:hypothetical protein